MPEEVSAESKLYVKEEIEKSRKDIREDVEKVNSKATKTFTTVAIVVGLLTGFGVYGLAVKYIDAAINEGLKAISLDELESTAEGLVKKIEDHEVHAKNSYNKIVEYEQEANSILASQSYKMLIGTIVPYGGEIVETTPGDPCEVQLGWFFCNGASLDRKEYKDLFDVIGVVFGEPNDSTFSLPDLRGRVTVGAGTGKGLTQRKLGKTGGKETHTLTIAEMPKHTHDWLRGTARDDEGFGGSEPEYVEKPGKIRGLIDSAGNDQPHENMQPFLVVNYIIKAR